MRNKQITKVIITTLRKEMNFANISKYEEDIKALQENYEKLKDFEEKIKSNIKKIADVELTEFANTVNNRIKVEITYFLSVHESLRSNIQDVSKNMNAYFLVHKNDSDLVKSWKIS